MSSESATPFEESVEASSKNLFGTPPQATFKRRNREGLISPSALRAGKLMKIKDEILMEKVQVMIMIELNRLKQETEGTMRATAEAYKKTIRTEVREELEREVKAVWKEEVRSLLLDEIKAAEEARHRKMQEFSQTFDTWKTSLEKCLKEKDAVIGKLEEEVRALQSAPKMRQESDHVMQKAVEDIKKQVENLREEEEQKTKTTSSWAERLFKTQEKMDEAEKWIEGAKKGTIHMSEATPTSTIINMTIEEERKRKQRALHVRITGLKDEGKTEEEVIGLLQRMGIPEPTHSGAWRVGKKGLDEKGNVKDRALILRFPTTETRKEFLKKRPSLKDTGIFLGDDLTLSQVAHMQELMPEIRAAREKGKIAFYRGGRVIILEKRLNGGSSSA